MDDQREFATHDENILAEFVQQAIAMMNDLDLTEHTALSRLAVRWLGYEVPDDSDDADDTFVDGSKDKGIDFWWLTDAGFEIFQIKTHELSYEDGYVRLDPSPFDAEGVKDLGQALNYLLNPEPEYGISDKLDNFRLRWDQELASRRMAEDEELRVLSVKLNLLVLGSGLTDDGVAKLKDLKSKVSQPFPWEKARIEFQVNLLTIQDVIKNKWWQENDNWVDRYERKRETVDLTPQPGSDFINAGDNVVFYCRAWDLVQAYDLLGYQIFEPNVRAEIPNSRVNKQIQKSVEQRKGRSLFRLLNNGVTIVCDGYKLPRDNKPQFTLTRPGVVNGLQTVVAMRAGWGKLSDSDKKDFEENCFVLVRVLNRAKDIDVNAVVEATNTQNPMADRNLKSNRPVQIQYERLFAELGWFYERKEGGWKAFCGNPNQWRTLPGKRKSHFTTTQGRPRKYDNLVVAQSWLSFIGLSFQASSERRNLFQDTWHETVFLMKPIAHARDYRYDISEMKLQAVRESAPARLMLAVTLATEFAKKVAPAARENREQALARNPDIANLQDPDAVKATLREDSIYILNEVLSFMSLVFTEFFGYMLFKALGQQIYDYSANILRNGSLAKLGKDYDLTTVVMSARDQRRPSNDLLPIAWEIFTQIVSDQMTMGELGQQYVRAQVKSKFLLGTTIRDNLCERLDKIDNECQRRDMRHLGWAEGMNPEQGLYNYVAQVVAGS